MSQLIKGIKKIGFVLRFSLFVFFDIFKASVRVAMDVLTPTLKAKPGLIDFPLDCESDNQITLLALLISLTPGTLTLDVSEDKKILLVHVMYLDTANAYIRAIKKDYEGPVREIIR